MLPGIQHHSPAPRILYPNIRHSTHYSRAHNAHTLLPGGASASTSLTCNLHTEHIIMRSSLRYLPDRNQSARTLLPGGARASTSRAALTQGSSSEVAPDSSPLAAPTTSCSARSGPRGTEPAQNMQGTEHCIRWRNSRRYVPCQTITIGHGPHGGDRDT